MKETLSKVQEPNLVEFMDACKSAMSVIDLYQDSRVCEKVYTKLEEAILWANVMIAQAIPKNIGETKTEIVPEEKIEIILAS